VTTVESLMQNFAEMYSKLTGHPSLYEIVLTRGRLMEVGKLTFDEARQIAELAHWSGFSSVNDFRIKECYLNAQKLITRHNLMGGGDELQYCEGYVAWEGGPLPIDHAWVTINGKVVDLTLRAKSKTTPHSYYGVAIPYDLVAKHQLWTKHYSPVIEGPFQFKALGITPHS
jgi:hypothetical protein